MEIKEHTEKQIKARQRNWAKARLLGSLSALNYCTDTFTPLEKEDLKVAVLAIKTVLSHWDKSTEENLGIKLKPYKCKFCGKRSNKEYIFTNKYSEKDNYCFRHFKMLKEDE